MNRNASSTSTVDAPLTYRGASIAACRTAAQVASTQAHLRKAAADVVDTLTTMNHERAIARSYRDRAADARARGQLGDAECFEATASFVSTQVERMRAEPAMLVYAAALVAVEDAIVADRAATRDLNSFGLD